MAEHTPTTDEVREVFVDGAEGDFIGEDFDRWLTAHDAELRAEVERLREGAGRALVDRDAYRAELDEARQQVADLRAGIEALLPGETVNVYAGGGNLVSQRRVVDPDRLCALLAGAGEQPGKGERAWLNADPRKAAENLRAVVGAGEQPGEDVTCSRCQTCGRDQRAGWCKHPAPVVPDVVRELDAVMHHHADRADAAEAEADRLAALLDVAQEDLAAAEALAVPDSAGVRERVWQALRESRRNGLGGMTEAQALDHMTDAVLAVVRPTGQEGL